MLGGMLARPAGMVELLLGLAVGLTVALLGAGVVAGLGLLRQLVEEPRADKPVGMEAQARERAKRQRGETSSPKI